MPLRTLASILKALNSEASPAQIAIAVCLGLIMGLTPLWSLHNLLVLFLVLLLRVNLGSFLLVFALSSGIAYALDPVFDGLGWLVLTAEPLQGLWTAFYNTTLGKLSDFNNTVLMGSLLASLVAAPLVYVATVWLVRRYRDRVQAWILRTRVYQMIRASRFYELYDALR